MRKLQDKNYYEILGILPGASTEEVKHAFEQVRKTYDSNSIAAYSLFSSQEREGILERIKEAYETLIDPQKRRDYDTMLGICGERDGRDVDKVAGDVVDIHRVGGFQEGSFVHKRQRRGEFKSSIVSIQHPDSFITDQYRHLCTRLDHIGRQDSIKLIAVSSAVKGEGKTVTSFNIAYILSKEFDNKVLLIEADLREPSFLQYLKIEKGPGLIDFMKGRKPQISEMCQIGESLYCIPAGKVSTTPLELFKKSKIRLFFEELKTSFDYIIVDSPPVIPMADMDIISDMVDGVLMVVKSGKTPRNVVINAIDSLKECRKIGVVLNGAMASRSKYYYHYY